MLACSTRMGRYEASVAEIDQANQPHFRVSTSGLLAVDLWIVLLVLRGVIKVDAGAINRFENESPPEIALGDSPLKGILDTRIDLP